MRVSRGLLQLSGDREHAFGLYIMATGAFQFARKARYAMKPELMELDAAADFIRVKPRTLRLYVAQRRVGHLRLGRRLYFREQDLADFIAAQIRPAAPSAAGRAGRGRRGRKATG